MRLLSRNIYRAFPELDQFDDETCERYINRCSKVYDTASGCFSMILVLVLSFTAWVFIEYYARSVVFFTLEAFDKKIDPYSEVFIHLLSFSGFIWFPWLSLLILRDRWLYKGIRKNLNDALCKDCEYSLLGLQVQLSETDRKYVLCPECGAKNDLQSCMLIEADNNPALQVSREA